MKAVYSLKLIADLVKITKQVDVSKNERLRYSFPCLFFHFFEPLFNSTCSVSTLYECGSRLRIRCPFSLFEHLLVQPTLC